ncbi:MAG: translational GTPase TypA [Christensenellales bacterium]
MQRKQEKIRNIAIVAHVDHGKTTLVDQMLRQSGTFRANEQVQERVMDSNDLERERGITILSKNTAVEYKGVRINIVDTPGHADFGGEVERILMMVDGILLLVDAYEGVMPQTRFVLQKALGQNKRIITVVNKVDREGSQPERVVDEVLDLFIELNASDEQLDFPVIYASARDGYASRSHNGESSSIEPLFQCIVDEIPCPYGDPEAPFQFLVSNIDYNDYVGRIGIGRIERGTIKRGQAATLCRSDGSTSAVKISRLYRFEGLRRAEVEEASMGEIVAISGIPEINIGETVCDPSCPEALDFIKIDEPTLSMLFLVNDSPFAGKDGKYVTSRNLRERLFKEILTNVSMHVEETDSADCFYVSGRGELHLSILIETMRREDYEFQVSRPNVIMKEKDGQKLEPMERLTVDVPDEYVGIAMEKLGGRKAELLDMHPNGQGGMRMDFSIPARCLMGYRSEFLTDTRGNGIMSHVYDGYDTYRGDMSGRSRGSMIAFEQGETTAYGLFNAQERGDLFLGAGIPVYEGMIVGMHAKSEDLVFNVCKKKHISNMRASGSDEALRLTSPVDLSLEQMLEFIADDELVEVTPKSIRMRKMILSKEKRNKTGRV